MWAWLFTENQVFERGKTRTTRVVDTQPTVRAKLKNVLSRDTSFLGTLSLSNVNGYRSGSCPTMVERRAAAHAKSIPSRLGVCIELASVDSSETQSVCLPWIVRQMTGGPIRARGPRGNARTSQKRGGRRETTLGRRTSQTSGMDAFLQPHRHLSVVISTDAPASRLSLSPLAIACTRV